MVFTAPPIAQTLTEIGKMADAGKVKPVVSTVLPLQEAKQAHKIIEGKHARGKVALQVVQ